MADPQTTDPVERWRSGDNYGANLMAELIPELRHEIRMLKTVLYAILDAYERGQGQPFATAMEEAAKMLKRR